MIVSPKPVPSFLVVAYGLEQSINDFWLDSSAVIRDLNSRDTQLLSDTCLDLNSTLS